MQAHELNNVSHENGSDNNNNHIRKQGNQTQDRCKEKENKQ